MVSRQVSMKIAVAGKGGVGKTLVAAGLAWSFARRGFQTIAVDADPTPNLGVSLGLTIKEASSILPISENAALIESKTRTGFPGVYSLTFSVDDIIRNYAVPTPSGAQLLVMGTVKSMGSGCTCAANTVLRSLIRHLVVDRNEALVLDMEAGLEHLGRGTAEGVDVMLIVTDANAKSLETGRIITRMAKESGVPNIFLVGNRIGSEDETRIVSAFAQETGSRLIGTIPYDSAVMNAGLKADPVMALEGSTAMKEIEGMTDNLLTDADSREKTEKSPGGRK
jgi:CO dehydrogenase maturation factor